MTHSPSRRTFLGASVATVASAPRLSADANDRIVVGVMGWAEEQITEMFGDNSE